MRKRMNLLGTLTVSSGPVIATDYCESALPLVRPGQTFRVVRYRPPLPPHHRGAADVDAAERARRIPELIRRAAKRLPLFD